MQPVSSSFYFFPPSLSAPLTILNNAQKCSVLSLLNLIDGIEYGKKTTQHTTIENTLNLSVDLMLRASDLLSLRIKDVMNESGSIRTEVKVKQKKTAKTTLKIPLSKNSIDVIKRNN